MKTYNSFIIFIRAFLTAYAAKIERHPASYDRTMAHYKTISDMFEPTAGQQSFIARRFANIENELISQYPEHFSKKDNRSKVHLRWFMQLAWSATFRGFPTDERDIDADVKYACNMEYFAIFMDTYSIPVYAMVSSSELFRALLYDLMRYTEKERAGELRGMEAIEANLSAFEADLYNFKES